MEHTEQLRRCPIHSFPVAMMAFATATEIFPERDTAA